MGAVKSRGRRDLLPPGVRQSPWLSSTGVGVQRSHCQAEVLTKKEGVPWRRGDIREWPACHCPLNMGTPTPMLVFSGYSCSSCLTHYSGRVRVMLEALTAAPQQHLCKDLKVFCHCSPRSGPTAPRCTEGSSQAPPSHTRGGEGVCSCQ